MFPSRTTCRVDGSDALAVTLSADPKVARRRLAWFAALALPTALLPFWTASAAGEIGIAVPLAKTFTGLLLLMLVGTASLTDLAWRKIPNWATYSAVLWGIGLSVYAAVAASDALTSQLGTPGLAASLGGMGVMLVLMFIVFSFTGGGAGDVKLVAALGALLGLDRAVDATLYSLLIAGTVVLVWAIWVHGPIKILAAFGRQLGSFLLPGSIAGPSGEHRQMLRAPIRLGPFFAAGTLLVLAELPVAQWLVVNVW